MARTMVAAKEEGAMEGAVAEAADAAAAAAGARTSLCLEKVKKERVHLRVPIKIVFDSCGRKF
jgi:hypothetical protein